MKKFIILIPLFNDWKSASKLLDKIDLQINTWNVEVSVIIVNDASPEERSGLDTNFKKIKSITILNMKENRVHQRCIAAGASSWVGHSGLPACSWQEPPPLLHHPVQYSCFPSGGRP